MLQIKSTVTIVNVSQSEKGMDPPVLGDRGAHNLSEIKVADKMHC